MAIVVGWKEVVNANSSDALVDFWHPVSGLAFAILATPVAIPGGMVAHSDD